MVLSDEGMLCYGKLWLGKMKELTLMLILWTVMVLSFSKIIGKHSCTS